jgi:hypothetical protein
MVIVFGKRTAGRVYQGDDQLVATVFFHLFFVPVIPLGSIRVTKKGFLLDAGEPQPRNRKSILAGYLRNLLAVILGFGFAMAFDGLFLNDVVERDKPSLVTIGTSVFAGGSLLWLWACFVLGSKANADRFIESAGRRFLAGTAGLLIILAAMFVTAHELPKPPTFERIAADRALSDEEAIRAIAALAFPKAKHIETTRDGAGVSLAVAETRESDATIRLFKGQTVSAAARITKGAAMLSLHYEAVNIVRHGSLRQLSELTISLSTVALDHNSRPQVTEVYRIVIPREKFAALLESEARFGDQLSRETLFSAEKIFADLGVVEVDNYGKFEFRPE